MAAQLLLLNEMLDFSLEEENLVNSDDDDIPILAAVATYMSAIFTEIKVFMKIFCLHIRSMNLQIQILFFDKYYLPLAYMAQF